MSPDGPALNFVVQDLLGLMELPPSTRSHELIREPSKSMAL
jgi:hypothetical protein